MREKRISKFVLQERATGRFVAISIVTNHLDLIAWISLPYFEIKYPTSFNQGLIYYFLGTAVDKSYRAMRCGIQMIQAIIDTLPERCIVAYDYTEIAEKGMSRFGNVIAHKFGTIGSIIDRQIYWAAEKQV